MEVADELRLMAAELAQKHPLFARQTIERLLWRTFEKYREAKIQTFVPVLVRRAAEEQLRYADAPPYPGISPSVASSGESSAAKSSAPKSGAAESSAAESGPARSGAAGTGAPASAPAHAGQPSG